MPLYNLMEDAATAEISRTQVWQWVHNPRGILDDGRKITLDLVRQLTAQELERIRKERGEARFKKGHFTEATRLFDELVASEKLEEFLTLKAYDLLDFEFVRNGNADSTRSPGLRSNSTKGKAAEETIA